MDKTKAARKRGSTDKNIIGSEDSPTQKQKTLGVSRVKVSSKRKTTFNSPEEKVTKKATISSEIPEKVAQSQSTKKKSKSTVDLSKGRVYNATTKSQQDLDKSGVTPRKLSERIKKRAKFASAPNVSGKDAATDKYKTIGPKVDTFWTETQRDATYSSDQKKASLTTSSRVLRSSAVFDNKKGSLTTSSRVSRTSAASTNKLHRVSITVNSEEYDECSCPPEGSHFPKCKFRLHASGSIEIDATLTDTTSSKKKKHNKSTTMTSSIQKESEHQDEIKLLVSDYCNEALISGNKSLDPKSQIPWTVEPKNNNDFGSMLWKLSPNIRLILCYYENLKQSTTKQK
jgi:hypothetical protein